MEKQFDAHGNRKRVLLPASKVVVAGAHLDSPEALRAKILRAYFKAVKASVLEGYEWSFPDGTTLCIKWERKVGAHGISRRHRGEDGYKEQVFNPRRLNQQYAIVMQGPLLKRARYRLERSEEFKRALTDILFNTDRQYRVR